MYQTTEIELLMSSRHQRSTEAVEPEPRQKVTGTHESWHHEGTLWVLDHLGLEADYVLTPLT